uniref:Bidirectional sugar transporter SWEET n=1 Tax=Leersia perrieri TaxID=77586 RepID=A0A0D9V2Q0_9ORYZ
MFFLDCICWTAYALIIFDSNLALPNGIGAVIGAVLLILYAWYYRSTPMMSKAKNIKMPVIVSCPGASAADTTGCIVSVTIER